MIDDFRTLINLLDVTLRGVPTRAWARRTGTRDKDWTLHEVLAHLVSVAVIFNDCADAAVGGKPVRIEGITRREDLRAWNKAQIAARSKEPPGSLRQQLIAELERAIARLEGFSVEELARTAHLPIYNRPAPAQDFLDWQLSHAGVVHAAQITRPLHKPPLWAHYPHAMLHRQVDRFMRHFSVAYWQDYGSGLEATLNFHIGGEAGGAWHLIANPQGGVFGRGKVDGARFNLHFASPEVLFGVFTIHTPLVEALQSGQLRIEGDVEQTMAVIKLFVAQPPREKLSFR